MKKLRKGQALEELSENLFMQGRTDLNSLLPEAAREEKNQVNRALKELEDSIHLILSIKNLKYVS